MFQNGIEEQLVKEKTGHKSDAVRQYKRTSDQLMKQAEKAVICGDPQVQEVVPYKRKEFDIDDDIASFELFCTKKYPKSSTTKSETCCSNGLYQLFGAHQTGDKKVKKVRVSIEYF